MKFHHELRPGLTRGRALAASSGIGSLSVLLMASTLFGATATTRVRAQAPGVAEPQPGQPHVPEPAQAPQPSLDTRRWRRPEPNLDPKAVAAAAVKDAPDPRGALGWEIVGGVVPAVSGVALIMLALRGDGGGGHVPSFHVNMPTLVFGTLLTVFGPAAGVSIAGSATGGRGSPGFAYLGTAAGLPLSLPGMVAGSVIGYRLSAETPDPPQCASAGDVMLQIDGKL